MAAGGREAHRRRLDELYLRLVVKRAELERAASAAQALHAQLLATRVSIAGAERELAVLEARVQLVAATASARRHEDAYRRRIVEIYQHGELSYLEFLLQARTFAEFAERVEDLRLLIAADQRTVAEREQARRIVSGRETEVERATVELESAAGDQERTRVRLAALAAERENLVAVADQQRAGVAREVRSLDALSESEERALEAAIAERQRELEARRAAAPGSASAPAHGSGRFMWPVSGPITSPFGYRTNPFGGAPDLHPGLDIAASTGTCSRIDVTIGQDVARG